MKYEFEQIENYRKIKLENKRKLYEKQINRNEKIILKLKMKLEDSQKQLSTSCSLERDKLHAGKGELNGQITRQVRTFNLHSNLEFCFHLFPDRGLPRTRKSEKKNVS